MVNHSNEYRPPKPGDGPDQWKDTVSALRRRRPMTSTLGTTLVLGGPARRGVRRGGAASRAGSVTGPAR